MEQPQSEYGRFIAALQEHESLYESLLLEVKQIRSFAEAKILVEKYRSRLTQYPSVFADWEVFISTHLDSKRRIDIIIQPTHHGHRMIEIDLESSPGRYDFRHQYIDQEESV